MTSIINIKKFIDVSTSVSSTPQSRRDFRNVLFVEKATDGAATTLTAYSDLASVTTGEGSNAAATKMATIFYGGGANGVSPSSTVYVAKISASSTEDFTTNFTALMTSGAYYGIALTNELAEEGYSQTAATIVEAGDIAHYLYLLDTDLDAVDKDLETDTGSIVAKIAAANITHTAVFWTDEAKKDTYPNVSAMSYFSTVRFTTAAPLGTLAYKVISLAEAVEFTGSTVTPTVAWENLSSKSGNAYLTLGEAGRTCFQAGTCGSGDSIDEYFAADYLNYTITYNVYDLLTSVSKLPMNSTGATMLSRVISSGFEALNTAGVIGSGTSLDGESFGSSGYKLTIPIPTGTSKATGLWEGIVCKALLTGSCKKVVIGNTLEK